MSSTIDSKPDLQPSENGHTEPRFTLAQLFPASVRETIVGPNKTGWATTVLYIAGATLCLGITAGIAWLNRPAAIAEYGKVGQKFFADFVDPTLAMSLEVSTFDSKNVEPREFKVKKSGNGQWIIPSHHDYPADAEERLANTGASVIGVERGAMVTRWSADHPKYGVVDPKQDSLSVDEVDGVGQRLTLKGESDSVLVDFIVGKQVEGQLDQYYVRHPDEDEVYITTLNVDLSTKFTDWIDSDLFDLTTSDVRQLTVNDYSFNELNGSLTQSEVTELTREGSGDDWKLTSLDFEKEQVNKDAIRETLNEIAGLAITGVRPKQMGLTPDLKLDREALKSQSGVDRLQSDLLASGFLLQPAEGKDKDQLKLIAREGELMAGTKDGLVYRLHFGRAFAGSQEELEIGFVSINKNSEENEPDDNSHQEQSVESKNASEELSNEPAMGEAKDSDNSTKPGRYVFVRVDFDKTLLGDEPSKPTEPTKPARLIELEEYEAAASSSMASESQNLNGDSKSVNETESSSDAATKGAELDTESGEVDLTKTAEVPEVAELKNLREKFNSSKSKYEAMLKAYEDYQSKVTSGQEKAASLNQRFANWYYVISGDAFDKLALDRESIVSEKPTEDEAPQISSNDNQSVAPEGGLNSNSQQLDSLSDDSGDKEITSEDIKKNDVDEKSTSAADSSKNESAEKNATKSN